MKYSPMRNLVICIVLFVSVYSCSQDSTTDEPMEPDAKENPEPEPELTWKTIPVPADPGTGKKWEFQESISDDFSYDFNPSITKTEFGNGKWTNFYHNNWEGPGPTIWKPENSIVEDGELKLLATREAGENKSFTSGSESFNLAATRLGCVTSTVRVIYPVFVEAYVKIANGFIASDIWMLSPDDTQEIDILEAYGAQSTRNSQEWYSKRLHISHHVFIRDPFQDYQPKDQSTWYAGDGNTLWSQEWLRIGVYWKSPTELEYYLNGELIKTMESLDNAGTKDGIDPNNFTSPTGSSGDRTGLSKEMDIIINAEVQNWNAAAGRMPTDAELNNTDDHTLKVDWIRIFKPVDEN